MQTPSQNVQPNFVQTLLQNLPQNMAQQFAQGQTLAPQKSYNFAQNLSTQQNTGAPLNQNQQSPNQNNMAFNPNVYFQNPPQNFGNFPGYYGVPAQMNNPQINRSSGTKNTSSVDISQIPLVNSMFKTPSRDAVEENSNASGTNNNIS